MAIIEVGEEVATATGFLAWVSRWGSIGVGLAQLLLGGQNPEPTLNNALGPFAQFLRAPYAAMHSLFDATVTFAQTTYNALARVHQAAAVAAHRAEIYAQGLYNRAVAHANQVGAVAVAHADAAARTAETYAQGLYNRAVAHSNAVGAATRAHADAVAHQAAVYAQGLYNRAVAHTDTVAVGINRRVDATATGLRTYADTVSTRAAARSSAKLSADSSADYDQSWAGLHADLAAMSAAGAAGMPAIAALIAHVPTAAPATLPEAMTAVGRITRVLTRTEAECGIPNCRNVGKFGRDLHGLGDLIAGAGFLAFLAWWVHHPEEGARDVARIGGEIVDVTATAVRDLIGV